MIELSNSKKTFLGNTPQGKNRFALDCSIGAVQFKDNLGAWQDIAPRLVRSGDKYISEGVPYRMEFDSKGGRREYPDRYDLSKYIDLPAMPLVSEVSPKFRADKIVYSTNDYDITMGLGKTGTFLEVLFRKAPTLNKLALDASSVGMDIGQLLLSKSGLGIPRPRLIDSSEMPIERMLDWSFKSGQLEVGFDFSGLKFPVLFKNSPLDVQVGASLDDAWEREYDGASFTYGKMFTTAVDVYNTSSAEEYGKDWGGYRFVSAGFPPQGTTIDVAYFSGYQIGRAHV